MTKRTKLKLVPRTDMDIARRRLRHLGITPLPPRTLPQGKPAPAAKPASEETALRCLAVHLHYAANTSALR